MKQRIKMATAIVHDPTVLLLDEPFNGMDPRQRLHLMELLHRLGDEGRTILFSSHILEEVEQVAGRIEVVVDPSLGQHQAGLVATLRGGRAVQIEVPAALGSVERPMTRRDIEAKAASVLGATLGAEGAPRPVLARLLARRQPSAHGQRHS